MEPLLSTAPIDTEHKTAAGCRPFVKILSDMEDTTAGIFSATLRCVLVGDSGVGKTSLLRAIAACSSGGSGSDAHRPAGRLAQPVTLLVDLKSGQRVRVVLEDTPGADSMDLLRPRLYDGTGAFLLCCSAACRVSADHLVTKWLPEVSRYRPGAPCLVLATQSDRQKRDRKTTTAIRRATKAAGCGAPTPSQLACSAATWRQDGAAEIRLVESLARLALVVQAGALPVVLDDRRSRRGAFDCLAG